MNSIPLVKTYAPRRIHTCKVRKGSLSITDNREGLELGKHHNRNSLRQFKKRVLLRRGFLSGSFFLTIHRRRNSKSSKDLRQLSSSPFFVGHQKRGQMEGSIGAAWLIRRCPCDPCGQKSQPANKFFENSDLGAAIDGDVGRPEHA